MTESRKKTKSRPRNTDNLAMKIMGDRRRLEKRRQVEKDGNILRIAEGLIYSERNKIYGHPTENFNDIASLWNVYFNAIKRRPDIASGMEMKCFQINNIDVAYMNILTKVARGATNQQYDDGPIDIAGYAGCIERITKNK